MGLDNEDRLDGETGVGDGWAKSLGNARAWYQLCSLQVVPSIFVHRALGLGAEVESANRYKIAKNEGQ